MAEKQLIMQTTICTTNCDHHHFPLCQMVIFIHWPDIKVPITDYQLSLLILLFLKIQTQSNGLFNDFQTIMLTLGVKLKRQRHGVISCSMDSSFCFANILSFSLWRELQHLNLPPATGLISWTQQSLTFSLGDLNLKCF